MIGILVIVKGDPLEDESCRKKKEFAIFGKCSHIALSLIDCVLVIKIFFLLILSFKRESADLLVFFFFK